MYTQDNKSLPVWIILSPAHHHISINSQPFLVRIVSEDTNQIKEASAAASPQEELAASMEHSDEQQQTCSSRVVHNTACYLEGLEQ